MKSYKWCVSSFIARNPHKENSISKVSRIYAHINPILLNVKDNVSNATPIIVLIKVNETAIICLYSCHVNLFYLLLDIEVAHIL